MSTILGIPLEQGAGTVDINAAEQYELERQVYEFAVQGLTVDEIGHEMGLDRKETIRILKRALESVKKYNAALIDHMRNIENTRLEIAVRGIWPLVQAGNLRAIETLIKLSKRKSELWGLDSPTKLALTDPEGNESKPSGLMVTFVPPVPR